MTEPEREAPSKQTSDDKSDERATTEGGEAVLQSELAPADYQEFLGEIKQRIQQAQVRAALSVNRELLLLYWHIGQDILSRQQEQRWGGKVIDRLAADLRRAFPGMSAFFSRRNLHRLSKARRPPALAVGRKRRVRSRLVERWIIVPPEVV